MTVPFFIFPMTIKPIRGSFIILNNISLIPLWHALQKWQDSESTKTLTNCLSVTKRRSYQDALVKSSHNWCWRARKHRYDAAAVCRRKARQFQHNTLLSLHQGHSKQQSTMHEHKWTIDIITSSQGRMNKFQRLLSYDIWCSHEQ